MIYILIALALLGALTFTLTRQAEQGGDDIAQDQADLLATQVIAYAGAAKQVIDQMTMSGSNVNALSFVTPNQTSFDTGSNIHKVYHPSGGGLSYKTADPKFFDSLIAFSNPEEGFYIGRYNNTVWTPTSALDVLFSVYGIKQSICEALNRRITGSPTIPTHGSTRTALVPGEYHNLGTNSFNPGQCPACEGMPSLCVSNGDASVFIYYSILLPK